MSSSAIPSAAPITARATRWCGRNARRQSARGSSKTKYPHFGCTSWPAPAGGSYAACPNLIVLHRADGSAVTVLRRHLPKSATAYRGWYFVQPSPDGKWLLLEDALGACGTATWAEFQHGNGGPVFSAFPDAVSSQALGWLPDNTAIVAAQTVECDGAPVGGIYQVTPAANWAGGPSAQLIFPAVTQDATTWGFGR